ncbi:MAG: outer membrane protein [Nitrospirota bacterium]
MKKTLWIIFLFLFLPETGYSGTVENNIGDKERAWHYTLYASMLKSGPGIGFNLSYSIEDRRRVELDIAYGLGTNKGRNFVISIDTLNLAYDLVKSKKSFSLYITGGIGIAFLELQDVSIDISRENAFAYSIGMGWRYNLMEKLSFTFDTEKGWVNPLVERVELVFDIRSIGTTSDLFFTGGATFGKISLGLNIGL